jgi:hypothetical protein
MVLYNLTKFQAGTILLTPSKVAVTEPLDRALAKNNSFSSKTGMFRICLISIKRAKNYFLI